MGEINQRVKPRRLKGFQDYTPPVMYHRLRILSQMRAVAQLGGFEEIATPALEYSEVLLGVGGETDKQVFCFQDNGERDVGLRFDLTVPFARYVAEHLAEIPLPFKRLQMADVWRAEKPQKGRYREFGQCDLDIIGADSIGADAEVVLNFMRVLTRLEVGPFTVQVNHRRVLTALIEKYLQTDTSQETAILIAIDKLDKIGPQGVSTILEQIPGLAVACIPEFLSVLTSKNAHGETDLSFIADLLKDDPKGNASVSELRTFLGIVQNSLAGTNQGKIHLNLAVARGLGYYTGVVFETTLDGQAEFGSICSGGRYDHLLERFSNQPLSGVGGSLGIDRLVAALSEREQDKEQSAYQQLIKKRVYLAVAGDETLPYAFQLADQLRAEQIPTEIGLKTKKLALQFKYADRRGIPLVLVVGSEEENSQTVTLKVMSTGVEKKGIPLSQVVAEVRGHLP